MFERYKYNSEQDPKIDYSSAGGDLLREMQMAIEVTKDRAYYNDFARVSFAYYEDLQEKLTDDPGLCYPVES